MSDAIKPPTIPIRVPVSAYLADHRAEGRSILPAVVALQYMAGTAKEHHPGLDVGRARTAEFVRFLELPAGPIEVEAEVDLEPGPGESLTARLLTRARMGKTGITRAKVHVEVEYGQANPRKLPTWDSLSALDGVCCSFGADQLYMDLVPFGPSFHNAVGTIHLSGSGAYGTILAADLPAPMDPLGNPFVLDAAFHLACAWGQRYANRLTFPTGFAERVIERPCRTGEKYACRVVPVAVEPDRLMFDLYLLDLQGLVHEACLGVRMQDVAQGRMSAAPWVQAHLEDPLKGLRARCANLSVVELDAVAPYYQKAYTARERGRDLEMGAKRSRSFAGARLALKVLARRITQDRSTPAADMQTVSDDRIHPILPLAEGGPNKHCAAAHDDRFAVAVASEHPIGVDVERLSGRVMRARRLYMSDSEQALLEQGDLEPAEVALRVWTVKEAAAKALDIPLAKAFSRVQVSAAAEDRCTVLIDGVELQAHCACIDDHVVTLVMLSPQQPA